MYETVNIILAIAGTIGAIALTYRIGYEAGHSDGRAAARKWADR